MMKERGDGPGGRRSSDAGGEDRLQIDDVATLWPGYQILPVAAEHARGRLPSRGNQSLPPSLDRRIDPADGGLVNLRGDVNRLIVTELVSVQSNHPRQSAVGMAA